MKNLKPERRVDGSGKHFEDYWPVAKKMIGDMKFLESLKEYDKDNIDAAIVTKIRTSYLKNHEFNPALIKNISSACTGLCKWVIAICRYDEIFKIVAPKKESLKNAQDILNDQLIKLDVKKKKLAKIVAKLEVLNDKLTTKQIEQRELESRISVTKLKLERAEKILDGLMDEKERWTMNVESLTNTFENLIGDILVCAGFITYLGPFNVDYRNVREIFLKLN